MNAIFYLVWANAVIWLGMGSYIIFIAVSQKHLRRRLQELEKNDGQ